MRWEYFLANSAALMKLHAFQVHVQITPETLYSVQCHGCATIIWTWRFPSRLILWICVCKDDSVFESRSGIIYVECFLFDRLRGSWLNCTSTMPMSSFFSCVIEQWVPLYNAMLQCVLSIKSVSFFSKRLLFLAWCLQMKSSLSRYPIWNNWNTTRPRRYSTRKCKKL